MHQNYLILYTVYVLDPIQRRTMKGADWRKIATSLPGNMRPQAFTVPADGAVLPNPGNVGMSAANHKLKAVVLDYVTWIA